MPTIELVNFLLESAEKLLNKAESALPVTAIQFQPRRIAIVTSEPRRTCFRRPAEPIETSATHSVPVTGCTITPQFAMLDNTRPSACTVLIVASPVSSARNFFTSSRSLIFETCSQLWCTEMRTDRSHGPVVSRFLRHFPG